MSTAEAPAEPQLVPVNAIFSDDFVEILVAITTADTIAEVAGKVAHHVEGKRVRARDADKVVYPQRPDPAAGPDGRRCRHRTVRPHPRRLRGRIRRMAMDNPVGPILRSGDDVDLVVAAIEDDNPDVEIEVIDHGSYVRIQAEDYLRVTADSLRRYLGADFEIRSLEGMLTAFAGRINMTSEAIEWSLGRHPAPATSPTPAPAG